MSTDIDHRIDSFRNQSVNTSNTFNTVQSTESPSLASNVSKTDSQLSNKQIAIACVASGITVFVALACYFLFYRKIFPVGDNTILTGDSGQQYIKFIAWAKQVISKHESLVFSFSKGFGGEMYSTWAYYLISPFNIILLFCSRKYLSFGIAMVTWLKYATGAGCMTLYLLKSKVIDKCNEGNSTLKLQYWAAPVFSLCFALSTWSTANLLNFIWMDVLWLLPLIVLTAENLVMSKRMFSFGFIFSVAGLLFCSYYMAYMVGIFVVFYCIFVAWMNGRVRAYFKIFLNGLLSFGLSAVLLIPTFYQLMSGKLSGESDTNLGNAFIYSITPKQWINQVARFNIGFGGSADLPDNMAHIYCGVLIGLLLIVFLVTEAYNIQAVRMKIGYITLFVLLFLGIGSTEFNLIWHGGRLPVWYNYRYMFLWAFLSVILAYMAWLNLCNIKWYTVAFSGAVLAIMANMGFLLKLGTKHIVLTRDNIYIADVLIGVDVILLATIAVLYKKQNKSIHSKYKLPIRIIQILCCISLTADVFTNTFLIFDKMPFLPQTEEYEGYKNEQLIQQDLHATENNASYCSPVRTLQNYNITLNNNLESNLYSGSVFNSNLENGLKQWQHNFGHAGDNNIMIMSGVTPIESVLLGYQHYVTQNEHNINQLYENNNVSFPVYDNQALSKWYVPNSHQKQHLVKTFNAKYTLPLSYVVSNNIKNVQLSNNAIYNENLVLNNMLRNKHMKYYITKAIAFKRITDNTPKSKHRHTYIVTYKFTIPHNNDLYVLYIPNAMNNLKIYKNGVMVSDLNTLSRIKLPLYFNAHDQITAKATIKTSNFNYQKYLDNDTLMGIYHYHISKIKNDIIPLIKLNQSIKTSIDKRNNKIIIYVPKLTQVPQKGMLITTFTNMNGYSAIEEKNNLPLNTILGTWIGVPIKNTSRPHTIVIKYNLPYLQVSIIVSLISLAICICIFVIQFNHNKNR